MRRHIRCGRLFTGFEDRAVRDRTLVLDGGRIAYVGESAGAPKPGPGDEVIDHSGYFVMPGLIDVHGPPLPTAMPGRRKTSTSTPRSSSGRCVAWRRPQRVLAAGFTFARRSDHQRPGHAVDPGRHRRRLVRRPAHHLLPGRQITNRQGAVGLVSELDRRPRHLDRRVLAPRRGRGDRGDPDHGQGRGRFHQDLRWTGDSMNPMTSVLVAGYNQEETTAMVAEAHRLGKKVVVHARGGRGRALFGAGRGRRDPPCCLDGRRGSRGPWSRTAA